VEQHRTAGRGTPEARTLGQSANTQAGYLRHHVGGNRIDDQGCRHLAEMQAGQLIHLILGSSGLRQDTIRSEDKAVSSSARENGGGSNPSLSVVRCRCRQQQHRDSRVPPPWQRSLAGTVSDQPRYQCRHVEDSGVSEEGCKGLATTKWRQGTFVVLRSCSNS
jgi:hypothetical protein